MSETVWVVPMASEMAKIGDLRDQKLYLTGKLAPPATVISPAPGPVIILHCQCTDVFPEM